MKWELVEQGKVLFCLIDFQEKFFKILPAEVVKQSKSNIMLMVKMFKELKIPMIGTEHNAKGLGPTDSTVLKDWSGPAFTDKVTFSCCGSDAFLSNLEKNTRPTVIIAGLETQICVLQTTLDLLKRGYQVLVVKDAVISSTKLRWQNGLDLAEEAGAKIVNTETVLFYLLKRIDRPEFKTLLKYIKEIQQGNI